MEQAESIFVKMQGRHSFFWIRVAPQQMSLLVHGAWCGFQPAGTLVWVSLVQWASYAILSSSPHEALPILVTHYSSSFSYFPFLFVFWLSLSLCSLLILTSTSIQNQSLSLQCYSISLHFLLLHLLPCIRYMFI